jgi:hypothetical protein
MLALVLSACDPSAGTHPGQVITTFDGGKKLVLIAEYQSNAAAVGISAWADVTDGTAGILEMTGPLHMRCQGQFRPPDPMYQDPFNLPDLDFGDGGNGASMHAPRGRYTATVTIPAVNASIQKSFDVGYSSADAITGIYDLPSNCVPIADSADQLGTLLSQYVMAVHTWVVRMDDSPLRSQLLQLSIDATRALESADHPAALGALTAIINLVQPLVAQNPYYDIRREAVAAVGLLNQPVPVS